ncbi:FHA domain-containing protein [Barrientosiimonas humi]|uniref:FHA domain-containing protein n=1 Tax=Barrientosiimonas humi TaxID=999931 RepID=A0A542XG97_9MICO|nr:DUF3662 and FHA domain-containing protein [Barrientosiimonas humi]TQL34842.1 FHA domain-containing protein [Barrientosiimonas humi]CAG7570996.1 FHA domain-containing protein FhaA [Barrientosiimonas humi]
MGLFDKLERRLERTVNGAFAKAFRAEVQPVEIASAMRRAMDNRASSISKNQRPIVPNVFDVELSQGDFERLTAYREELSDELIASALEHVDTQRYTAGGPVAVTFSENTELETGVFHIRSSTAKNVENLEPVRPAERDEPESAQQGGDQQAYDYGGYPDPGATQRGGDPSQWPTDSADQRPEPQAGPDAPTSAAPLAPHAQPTQHAQPDAYPQPGAYAQPTQQSHPGQPGAHAQPTQQAQPPAAAPKPPPPPRPKKQRPWLDIDGERYPLLSAMTIIGRDDSADVILDDPGISRQHSEIRVTYDGPHLVATLRDLGSTNGTYVNGDPVSRARLIDGDRITVGRTTFTIHMGGRR